MAVREFILEKPQGCVDYLLFVNGRPAGVIEAKPEGITLVEVEHQSRRYVEGPPTRMTPPVYPLPFIWQPAVKKVGLDGTGSPSTRYAIPASASWSPPEHIRWPSSAASDTRP